MNMSSMLLALPHCTHKSYADWDAAGGTVGRSMLVLPSFQVELKRKGMRKGR